VLSRAKPLQIVPKKGKARLYVGRDWVELG